MAMTPEDRAFWKGLVNKLTSLPDEVSLWCFKSETRSHLGMPVFNNRQTICPNKHVDVKRIVIGGSNVKMLRMFQSLVENGFSMWYDPNPGPTGADARALVRRIASEIDSYIGSSQRMKGQLSAEGYTWRSSAEAFLGAPALQTALEQWYAENEAEAYYLYWRDACYTMEVVQHGGEPASWADPPDYADVVKTPMYVHNLFGKLFTGRYASAKEVRADMLLVFDNAIAYYCRGLREDEDADYEMGRYAPGLRANFETFWAKESGCWGEYLWSSSRGSTSMVPASASGGGGAPATASMEGPMGNGNVKRKRARTAGVRVGEDDPLRKRARLAMAVHVGNKEDEESESAPGNNSTCTTGAGAGIGTTLHSSHQPLRAREPAEVGALKRLYSTATASAQTRLNNALAAMPASLLLTRRLLEIQRVRCEVEAMEAEVVSLLTPEVLAAVQVCPCFANGAQGPSLLLGRLADVPALATAARAEVVGSAVTGASGYAYVSLRAAWKDMGYSRPSSDNSGANAATGSSNAGAGAGSAGGLFAHALAVQEGTTVVSSSSMSTHGRPVAQAVGMADDECEDEPMPGPGGHSAASQADLHASSLVGRPTPDLPGLPAVSDTEAVALVPQTAFLSANRNDGLDFHLGGCVPLTKPQPSVSRGTVAVTSSWNLQGSASIVPRSIPIPVFRDSADL